VDWEEHPAEGIFSASATHYLVKRAGLDITNYGTVKIKTAHQLRSADQKPGGRALGGRHPMQVVWAQHSQYLESRTS
jgi:hypothetical protein